MNRILFPTLAYFAVSCLPSVATAAAITGGSIAANVNAPTGGGSASNSVTAVANPAMIKFVGDIELTSSSGGTSSGNSLVIVGTVSLDPGEAFTLAYDYNVNLAGGGTVLLTTTAITTFGDVTETLSNNETIKDPGLYNFTFSELALAATTAGTGTWQGRFEFDWIDAPADSSLNIVIPNNSIDFAITAVPEPTGLAAMCAASLLMATRRRRRAI